MNLPTLLVLLLVVAALVIAILAWRRAGGAGSCGCDAAKCSGCSSAAGCPYCKGSGAGSLHSKKNDAIFESQSPHNSRRNED